MFEMRQMGYTFLQIAGTLGVSEDTVARDYKMVRNEVRARLQPSEISDMIIEAFLRFESLYAKAMNEYTKAAVGSIPRSRALEVGLKANALGIRLLQDVGMIPKAPIDVHLLDHPDLRKLKPEERAKVAEGLQRFLALMSDGVELQDMLRAIEVEMDGHGDDGTGSP